MFFFCEAEKIGPSFAFDEYDLRGFEAIEVTLDHPSEIERCVSDS